MPATQADAFRRAQERALQEARAIAGFRSRSIVDVHDMFRENDTAYIVMEYLEGQTLEERIQREDRVPPDEVLQIAQALCEALAEVHAGRLLHRDVKPANIVLTADGRTVLIDFGSAREFQANRTQRHTRILTEKYAAPEQYLEEGRFGPYTDVFGLGATLYHALMGAPPPAAVDRLQGRRALALPDALPASLAAVLQQALELRVDGRLQSMAAFLDLITDGHAAVASSALSSVSSPDSDREALEAFYTAANGATWTNNTAWRSDRPLADWYGVTVDDIERVIELKLATNGLSGSIPSELGRLSHLQKLSIGGNRLSGTIPAAIGRLTHLKELVLSNNQLSGRLPTELSRLLRLERLSLSHNRLSGSIPAELSRLTNLKELVLCDNQLSGTIPAEISRLPHLKKLMLHRH